MQKPGTMPPFHFFIGIVPTIFEIAVVIALVWLMIRLGRLADTYSAKLKVKTTQ
jgi:hypothetical protein